MTEEEAKTKWCPHARVLSDEGSMVIATVNRGNGLQAKTNCIASDCMMWKVITKAGGGLKYDHGCCGLTK
jgi:hypothetical protein